MINLRITKSANTEVAVPACLSGRERQFTRIQELGYGLRLPLFWICQHHELDGAAGDCTT